MAVQNMQQFFKGFDIASVQGDTANMMGGITELLSRNLDVGDQVENAAQQILTRNNFTSIIDNLPEIWSKERDVMRARIKSGQTPDAMNLQPWMFCGDEEYHRMKQQLQLDDIRKMNMLRDLWESMPRYRKPSFFKRINGKKIAICIAILTLVAVAALSIAVGILPLFAATTITAAAIATSVTTGLLGLGIAFGSIGKFAQIWRKDTKKRDKKDIFEKLCQRCNKDSMKVKEFVQMFMYVQENPMATAADLQNKLGIIINSEKESSSLGELSKSMMILCDGLDKSGLGKSQVGQNISKIFNGMAKSVRYIQKAEKVYDKFHQSKVFDKGKDMLNNGSQLLSQVFNEVDPVIAKEFEMLTNMQKQIEGFSSSRNASVSDFLQEVRAHELQMLNDLQSMVGKRYSSPKLLHRLTSIQLNPSSFNKLVDQFRVHAFNREKFLKLINRNKEINTVMCDSFQKLDLNMDDKDMLGIRHNLSKLKQKEGINAQKVLNKVISDKLNDDKFAQLIEKQCLNDVEKNIDVFMNMVESQVINSKTLGKSVRDMMRSARDMSKVIKNNISKSTRDLGKNLNYIRENFTSNAKELFSTVATDLVKKGVGKNTVLQGVKQGVEDAKRPLDDLKVNDNFLSKESCRDLLNMFISGKNLDPSNLSGGNFSSNIQDLNKKSLNVDLESLSGEFSQNSRSNDQNGFTATQGNNTNQNIFENSSRRNNMGNMTFNLGNMSSNKQNSHKNNLNITFNADNTSKSNNNPFECTFDNHSKMQDDMNLMRNSTQKGNDISFAVDGMNNILNATKENSFNFNSKQQQGDVKTPFDDLSESKQSRQNSFRNGSGNNNQHRR